MAEVKIDISDADLRKLAWKTMAFVERVAMDTNLSTDELIQKIGARAVTSAMKVTNSNVKPAGFQSHTPAKQFYRKLKPQASVKKHLKGGVWYAPTGESRDTSKKRKRKKDKDPKLQAFAKKRKKVRADQKQPFFVPTAIPGARKKGLRPVKMLIYLRGKGAQRRKGRFGTRPYLKDTIDKSDRVTWVRNTAASKLGWNNAISEIPMAMPDDKSAMLSKSMLSNHVQQRRKSRVRHTSATQKSGASIRITNLVRYAGLTHVGAGSDRIGMINAMRWFNGYWGKRKNIAMAHYKSKYGDVVS